MFSLIGLFGSSDGLKEEGVSGGGNSMCKDCNKIGYESAGEMKRISVRAWDDGKREKGQESKERWREEQSLAFVINTFSGQNSC